MAPTSTLPRAGIEWRVSGRTSASPHTWKLRYGVQIPRPWSGWSGWNSRYRPASHPVATVDLTGHARIEFADAIDSGCLAGLSGGQYLTTVPESTPDRNSAGDFWRSLQGQDIERVSDVRLAHGDLTGASGVQDSRTAASADRSASAPWYPLWHISFQYPVVHPPQRNQSAAYYLGPI
jgi:hypothetical protein